MSNYRFVWNEIKAQKNLKKHKVSFEEAKTVFGDDEALMISDTKHSENEERFLLLGLSATSKILVVCHCYRENDNVIRIISARKADHEEQLNYIGKKRI
jgi:uncharacterized protein